MNKFAVALCALVLAGCCTTPVIEVREVLIPVTVEAPQPPPLNRPAVPLARVTADTPDDEVIKIYAATVRLLQGYAESLEKIIDGYRRPDKGSGPVGPERGSP